MGNKRKALLKIAGEPLISRQIRLMAPVCAEILVVVDEPAAFSGIVPADIRVLGDDDKYRGPLSGMERGLREAKERIAWVVACDQPFVSVAAAETLAQALQLSSADAAVVALDGTLEPLHGCYDAGCAKLAAEQLAQGNTRVVDFLRNIRTVRLDETAFAKIADPRLFCFDIDTPKQLAQARKWASRS